MIQKYFRIFPVKRVVSQIKYKIIAKPKYFPLICDTSVHNKEGK